MISALLRILEFHRGRGAAISAEALLSRMQQQGYEIPGMPALRGLVRDARKQRHIIASCDEGYFLPADKIEADEFIERLRHPGVDLLQTVRIMRQASREQYGDAQQLRMI